MEYEKLFKDGSMSFFNVCRHFGIMRELDRWDGKFVNNVPICAIRHIDPMELFAIAKMDDAERISKLCNAIIGRIDTRWLDDFAMLVAKQLWDVLEEHNETENGGRWLIDTFRNTLKAFEPDTPIGAMMLAVGEQAALMNWWGKTMPKKEISKAFFDMYPGNETQNKDLNNEEFLPWLMPWLCIVADWRILPNRTAIPESRHDGLWHFKTFLERLVERLEVLDNIDTLKRMDEERYKFAREKHLMDKASDGFMSYTHVEKFRDFGEVFSARFNGIVFSSNETAQAKPDHAHWRTTRTWMRHYLSHPFVSKRGKVYPNIWKQERYEQMHLWGAGNYDDDVDVLDIGVQLGFLDADTLEIKTNPKTGRPYKPSDYDNGLLGDEIVIYAYDNEMTARDTQYNFDWMP